MTVETENNNGRILIVDDTVANLQVMSNLLEQAGYQFSCAANGKTALMVAENNPPDLILLDIRMPEMDGYEVCRRLKANDKTHDIPVIFISALDEVTDKIKGFETGAVDYITKPFEENEVLARVFSHVSLFRMRKELEEANDKLKALDRLKSMFIASMSHELRTPLNAIIGFSGILLRGLSGELNEKQNDDIQRINRSGKHLLELITDVIDISKIEAERIDIKLSTLSLESIVKEAVENLQPLAKEKGLTIRSNDFSAITMYTDKKRLTQSLINLISNAIKYSEQGNIDIIVTDNAEQVTISVKDMGVGIPEDAQSRMFDAFERIENSLKVKPGGTGLGLYLTKKIVVDLLKGKIKVESQENVGSTFSFTIPKQLTKPENHGV